MSIFRKIKNSLRFQFSYIKWICLFLYNCIISICTYLWNLPAKRKISFLYLFSIFLFAFIYWWIPQDFYHTTVKYETTFKEELNDVRASIYKIVIEDFEERYGKLLVTDGKTVFNIQNILFTDLTVEKGYLEGVFALSTRKIRTEKFKSHELKFRIYFNPKKFQIINKRMVNQVEVLSDLPEIFNEFLLFRTEFPLPSNSSYFTYSIRIPHNIRPKIHYLISANKGFPVKLKGSFWRMLYLSATTITTLGLGDILPITNRARILITIETILGMILIGLFINSIFIENKND